MACIDKYPCFLLKGGGGRLEDLGLRSFGLGLKVLRCRLQGSGQVEEGLLEGLLDDHEKTQPEHSTPSPWHTVILN